MQGPEKFYVLGGVLDLAASGSDHAGLVREIYKGAHKLSYFSTHKQPLCAAKEVSLCQINSYTEAWAAGPGPRGVRTWFPKGRSRQKSRDLYKAGGFLSFFALLSPLF